MAIYLVLTKLRNSSRVFGSSRKTPSIVDVTVLLLIFCTPRITMHMCLQMGKMAREKMKFSGKFTPTGMNEMNSTYTPSTTTATPAGWTAWVTATAICLVKRSCTWSRREKISTILQKKQVENPMSNLEMSFQCKFSRFYFLIFVCGKLRLQGNLVVMGIHPGKADRERLWIVFFYNFFFKFFFFVFTFNLLFNFFF